VLDLEQDRLSQLSRDAIERRRERVVLREIIVIDSSGKAVRTPQRALGCDDGVIFGKQGWVNSGLLTAPIARLKDEFHGVLLLGSQTVGDG
jgi:hypothetical protein